MAKKAMSTIVIRGGKVKYKVKIDREDRKRIEEKSWRVMISPSDRLRVITSVRTPKGSKSVTLGNFLMKPPKGKQVYSRRFNDGLDFRKENLIVCTMKERQRLLPKRKVNTSSRFRGVSFQKLSRKWRAALEVDGRNKNLGEFISENDAALAYNDAALKYFGKIAYQNRVTRKIMPRKR